MKNSSQAEHSLVLIVDDDEDVRASLDFMLDGYQTATAPDGESALEIMKDTTFDLVLLDITLPGIDGLEVLRRIKMLAPSTYVVMVSATDRAREATEAVKRGAFDYVTKPIEEETILAVVNQAISRRALEREVQTLWETNCRPLQRDMLYRSLAMERVMSTLGKVASAACDVLVTGESGTGKELVAKALHAQGSSSRGEFVAINCAAIPPELIESEIFGHERGAFTGALARKVGKFEYAGGGTLFLDEIASLRLDHQAKLLRVLQEREFSRVGSNARIKFSARLVAATNIPLEKLVAQGSFREDLYFRLNVIPIELPPLRERQGDVALLVVHFLDMFRKKHKRRIPGITPGAMAVLENYPWPGNIRELKNFMERAVLLGEEDCPIDEKDLPIGRLLYGDEGGAKAAENADDTGLMVAREAFERQYILRHLRMCDWNQSEAARRLRIHRNTLIKRMKALQISQD